jgi:hypothetical protein
MADEVTQSTLCAWVGGEAGLAAFLNSFHADFRQHQVIGPLLQLNNGGWVDGEQQFVPALRSLA